MTPSEAIREASVAELWAELVRRKHEVRSETLIGEVCQREDAALVVLFKRFRAGGPELIVYEHGGMAACAGLARLASRKIDYDYLRGEQGRLTTVGKENQSGG